MENFNASENTSTNAKKAASNNRFVFENNEQEDELFYSSQENESTTNDQKKQSRKLVQAGRPGKNKANATNKVSKNANDIKKQLNTQKAKEKQA